MVEIAFQTEGVEVCQRRCDNTADIQLSSIMSQTNSISSLVQTVKWI